MERDTRFELVRSVWKTDMLAANISPAQKIYAVAIVYDTITNNVPLPKVNTSLIMFINNG